MDFDKVFKFILTDFSSHQINFALIGGFALASWGYPRSTLDIDFLLDKDDLPKVKSQMTALGYDIAHESEEVITFQSKLTPLGLVDFLLAHRHYTKGMLARAKEQSILDERHKIKVVTAEDLIGLKVQASSNDPHRYHQDMADIEAIIRENYTSLDFKLIKEYFAIFKREKDLEAILEKTKNVK